MLPQLLAVVTSVSLLNSPMLPGQGLLSKPRQLLRRTVRVLKLRKVEGNMIDRMNSERARHGLAPLKADPTLMTSARRHAVWMASTGSLTHTTANVAENIAMGQQTSTEVTQSWMNSPGHRANMLNGGYSRVGAAAFKRKGGGRIYWCLQFLR